MEIYKLGSKEQLELIDTVKTDIYEVGFFDREDEQHLIVMSKDEFIANSSLFNFPTKAYNETLSDKGYPNAEFFDELLYVSLNEISYDTYQDKYFSSEINVYLGRTNIMIVGHNMSDFFNSMISKIDKSNIYKALYTLLDQILEHNKRVVHDLEKKVLKLEDQILKATLVTSNAKVNHINKKKPTGKSNSYLTNLVSIRKQIQFVKSYIDPTADIMEMLEMDMSEFIPSDYDPYFLKISLKADRLNSSILNIRDYLGQVREAWQGQMDLELNERMKVLTVISLVFMPLTLIVGWYGMNFQSMPELSWKYGYIFVIALSVVTFFLTVYWLRKNKYT